MWCWPGCVVPSSFHSREKLPQQPFQVQLPACTASVAVFTSEAAYGKVTAVALSALGLGAASGSPSSSRSLQYLCKVNLKGCGHLQLRSLAQ